MRIVVTGTGRLGINLLEPLLASRHDVVGVIQDGRKTKGWRRFFATRFPQPLSGNLSMARAAHKCGIPVIWIDKMTPSELAPLKTLEPDLILVGGFGIIFKPPILELPAIGCVNTHSSLLPRHRGPNPFSAVLMADDKQTGVTFHVMEPGIDTGDIIDQTAIDIGDADTMFTLYKRSCQVARDRVLEVIDRIERDGLAGTPQDAALATYEKKPSTKDAWIDWSLPAEALDRRVRALSPLPMPRFRFGRQTIFVAKTEVLRAPVEEAPGTVIAVGRGVKVATGDGALIVRIAFAQRPIPWLFPSPLCSPKPGARFE